MKKYTWLGIATVLFISFQNCAPVQKNGATQENSDPAISFEKTAIQDFSTIDLWDADCDESCTADQIRNSQAKFLHIKLYDRLVESFPIQSGIPHSKVCLSQAQVQALNVILSGAEVCTPVLPPGYFDDRMCTMQIQNPHSILDKDQPYEMAFGFKSNSCDVSANLCGDKGSQLEDWTRAVVSDFRADRLEPANDSGLCD